MIIRSQDKREITDDLNVYIVLVETSRENEVNAYIKNETRGTIGRYSTEEKAIKVLDMICKAYKDFCDYSNIKNNRLFEMPQDSEV